MYTAPLLAWLTEKRRQRARLEKAKLANGMADDSLAEGAQKEGELPKSYWDRKKARLDYERTLFRFEVEKRGTSLSMRFAARSAKCSLDSGPPSTCCQDPRHAG